MPPPEEPRPDEKELESFLTTLCGEIDRHYEKHPDPGRIESFRRLTRFEYANAIRDLLGLEVDAAAMLPKDESSHGFDNITVTSLSSTQLDRYITAARKISRLAVGDVGTVPVAETIRLRPDLTQEWHIEGLPFGTRGGASIPFYFPLTGHYRITVRLARDRNEHVEGLYEKHRMDLLVDRRPVRSFDIEPPPGRQDFTKVDEHLNAVISVEAGNHHIGVTFPARSFSLEETRRQPFDAHYNMHRHPRLSPAVYQVSIAGPVSSVSDRESLPDGRHPLFSSWPQSPEDETESARAILSKLAASAWRRPVNDAELGRLISVYRNSARDNGFREGLGMAISAILVSPEFLFRVERQPDNLPSGAPYEISPLELASRISFFLWSSLPDNDLIKAAVSGGLDDPESRRAQVSRMLDDPRSRSLATSFADQWLYLRNLDSITPDLRLYPDFDDNLRQAFKSETRLLFLHVLKEDRSVLELLSADYTFLNHRLASHYGIPGVQGSRFRLVSLQPESRRGGLLRHGSILTVTSYATRTSPVVRGNWILENILGTPPPPPPPNVPALDDTHVDASLPIRQRLERHREDPACSSCHNLMDPVGFALENFDAVGRWRTHENGEPVDAEGGLPDGATFHGVAGLEDGILRNPEAFVHTFTEKLMTYALGRGLDYQDAPAVRKIVRHAAQHDYRLSAIVTGIIESIPFKMRKAL